MNPIDYLAEVLARFARDFYVQFEFAVLVPASWKATREGAAPAPART